MKVLIAEDEAISRHVLQSVLKKWGYDVVAADSGVKALEILQDADPPRLAILDWMMPGLDGVEVCRRVRELGREPYIYILLLTARDTPEELVEGMEAVAHLALHAPFETPDAAAEKQALDGSARGTFVLLQAALAAKVPRVVLATRLDAAMGAYPANYLVDETWKPMPDAAAAGSGGNAASPPPAKKSGCATVFHDTSGAWVLLGLLLLVRRRLRQEPPGVPARKMLRRACRGGNLRGGARAAARGPAPRKA